VAAALAVVFALGVVLSFAGGGDGDSGVAPPTFGSGPPLTTPSSEPATTAPEVTTTIPNSDTERRDREACEERARNATITYQPAKTMVVNETERVEAIVTSGGAAPRDLEGDEPVEQREATLACSVEAELTGVDFEIQPSGPQATSFEGDTVEWSWNVKPERSGSDLSLLLTVRGFVDGADRGNGEAARVRGPAPILVDISVEAESKSVTERVADVWFGFWSSTVWTAIAGVLSVLALFGVRGRDPRAKPGGGQGPPPPPPQPPAGWDPPSPG
jgi:hypothetical protein